MQLGSTLITMEAKETTRLLLGDTARSTTNVIDCPKETAKDMSASITTDYIDADALPAAATTTGTTTADAGGVPSDELVRTRWVLPVLPDDCALKVFYAEQIIEVSYNMLVSQRWLSLECKKSMYF